jgi:hypothetical protein
MGTAPRYPRLADATVARLGALRWHPCPKAVACNRGRNRAEDFGLRGWAAAVVEVGAATRAKVCGADGGSLANVALGWDPICRPL